MRDRITGHAIDARCRVHLFNAVGIAQRACGNLSGRGLFTGIGRGKRELAAGTHRQHPADDPLFAHADADHGMRMAVLFQELHHHYIVIKRIRGAHHLEEICRVLLHPGESFFQLFGAAEVMGGKDQVG